MWMSQLGKSGPWKGTTFSGPLFKETDKLIGDAVSLLTAKGGQLFLAGPTNRDNSDGTGIIPVSGSNIGYVKSLTSNASATQATSAAKPKLVREPILGPELVVNGSGDSTAAWPTQYRGALTATGGEFVLSATADTAAGAVLAYQEITLIPGKNYRASCVARKGTASQYRWSAKRGAAGAFASYAVVDGVSTTNELKSFDFTATGADAVFQFQLNGTWSAGGTAYFDNASVREILGYKDVWSWEFDGVDDKLQFVPPSNFQLQTGGLLLCCVATPLRTSTINDIFLGVGQASLPSSRTMMWFDTVGRLQTDTWGTSGTNMPTGGYVAPLGVPVLATLWISGAYVKLRVNGAEYSAAPAGGTTVSAWDTGRIGSRHTDTANANVRVQAPVITSGITTLAEVQQIERAVAAAAGVTLA